MINFAENLRMEKRDKYYKDIEAQLQAKETKEILETLKDIRQTGHAYILPLIFKLINTNPNQQIHEEVFQMLGQVKEQDCVNYLVEEIKSGNSKHNITRLIATCWQSGLDYSQFLDVFVQQFVHEDYVTAIEAFTVIEEWMHNASQEHIEKCISLLKEQISIISAEKKSLYMELVKLFEVGGGTSSSDYL